MSNNIIFNKSKIFAVRIINLYKYLCDTKNEYVISKQLLCSGTIIGANIREAGVAQSKKDFIAKMNIALKEAAESEYWIELLYETNYISKNEFDSIKSDCSEINKLLTSIIKTSNCTL